VKLIGLKGKASWVLNPVLSRFSLTAIMPRTIDQVGTHGGADSFSVNIGYNLHGILHDNFEFSD
jgi:hypothetical protein